MSTQELEKSVQEIWSLFKETDRKFQETDRKFQETDRKFQETDRKFRETDRKFQETDHELARVLADTHREVTEMSRAVNALTGKWGKFVEGLLAPGVVRLFQKRSIVVQQVFQRAKAQRNGQNLEIDLLAANGEFVVAIEAKSSLSVADVGEHLEDLEKFKTFFPQYKNHKLIGAVAGIVIEENADRFAYQSGLFVIGQSGETVKILNDEKFIPRTW